MSHYREVMAGYMDGQRRRHRGEQPLGFLVGQAAPQPKPDTRHVPLFPYPRQSAGGRLHALSGWSLSDWFALWDTFNTIEEFPGRSGRGDNFPLGEARKWAAAHRAARGLLARTCVFVGKANAQCYFDRLPDPATLVRTMEGGTWAWVPHTSGLVQHWNDPQSKLAARSMFGEILLKAQTSA